MPEAEVVSGARITSFCSRLGLRTGELPQAASRQQASNTSSRAGRLGTRVGARRINGLLMLFDGIPDLCWPIQRAMDYAVPRSQCQKPARFGACAAPVGRGGRASGASLATIPAGRVTTR